MCASWGQGLMSSSRGPQLLSGLPLPLQDLALMRGKRCQRQTPAPEESPLRIHQELVGDSASAVLTPSLQGLPCQPLLASPSIVAPACQDQDSLTVTCFLFSLQVTSNRGCPATGQQQQRQSTGPCRGQGLTRKNWLLVLGSRGIPQLRAGKAPGGRPAHSQQHKDTSVQPTGPSS